MKLLCIDEQATERLGLALGACLRPGDVVLLRGEMGAGKSVLTRAAAKGMGVTDPVPSPTFTILNIHEGRTMKLYHFDLYRLEGEDAFYEMGLEEFIPPLNGAAMIEWPEMAEGAMPRDALTVEIAYAEDGARRDITLVPGGAFDEARIGQIAKRMEESA